MSVRSLVVGAGGFPGRVVSEEDRAAGTVPFGPLPSVAGAVRRVARALTRAGVPTGEPLLDPDVETARSALDRVRSDALPVVVHFCGHGAVVGDDLYLAVRGSDPGDLPATALSSAELIRRVEHSPRSGPALFLLDVCGGGQALASQAALRLSGARRKTWVIAACAADEAAYGARFSDAAAAVLDRLARGWLDLSPALGHVPVDTLAAEIDRELRRSSPDGGGQTVVRTPHDEAVLEPPPFFRNPGHAADAAGRFLARTDAALRQFAVDSDPGLDLLHFASRAVGTTRADSCLFSGRAEQLRAIETWLDDVDGGRGRLLVVTGGPGSGKSALLGVTACLTHPALAPIRRRVVARVREFRPAPAARVLAVHARQLTTRQVVESLLRQLDGRGDTGNPDGAAPVRAGRAPEAPTTGHLLGLLRTAGPVVVILDALDEAADPGGLLRELLLPLSGAGPDDPAPHCRVLIGTRPWWDQLADLRHVVAAGRGTLLDLDAQSREDLGRDLEEYLTDLLYPHHAPATARAVAQRLARFADHGAFLIAALYADHLLGTPAGEPVVEPPCELTAMFDLQVGTLAAANPWIRPVLAVLGHARGQGMPLDLIHAVACAHAPAEDGPALPPSLQDTRDALTQASFYLRTTADTDGRLLYRYFHQALTDHTAPTVDAAVVLRALLDAVPVGADGRPDWALAHPYLLRHLPTHADESGRIDGLLADTEFVLRARPDALLPALKTARSGRARLVRAVYLASADRHRDGSLADRRFLLALDAARHRATELHRELCRDLVWRPRWATGMQTSPQLEATLTQPTEVKSVATTVLDGRPVAVSGGLDGTVRVWDLTTRTQRALLRGHTGIVGTAACTVVDGRAVAVTGSWDNTVRVWDLATGSRTAVLAGHTGWVETLACTVVDGRAVAVTGSWDGSARMWDLATGRQTGGILAAAGGGHVAAVTCTEIDGRPVALLFPLISPALVWDLETRQVRELDAGGADVAAVACTEIDGRPFAVTGHWFGDVGLRNLDTDGPADTLRGHTNHVEALACTTVGRRPVAVTGSGDGSVRVWDLEARSARAVLGGHGAAVDGVACAVVDGLPVAVTGSRDSTLRVWDLSSTAESNGLRGHTDEVRTAVFTEIGGTPVVLSGGWDKTVRVRDVETGVERAVLSGHRAGVTAVACTVVDGTPLAVTGSLDSSARVWDLVTGDQRIDLRTPNREAVDTVACATFDGTPVVVGGSRAGWVRVWDLTTGKPVSDVLDHENGVDALACTLVDGRPVVVTCSRDHAVRICDPVTGERLAVMTGHPNEVYGVACTGVDGRPVAVTAGQDRTVRVWDLATGTPGAVLTGHTSLVRAVACATVGGRPIAVTGGWDRTVRVWDLKTCEAVAVLPQSARVEAVAVRPDGTIAVGNGWDVVVLDPADGSAKTGPSHRG